MSGQENGPSTKIESKAFVREKLAGISAVDTLTAHAQTKAAYALKSRAQKPRGSGDVIGVDFLQSFEWRRLRMEALKKHGAKCQCCGATPQTGAVMNVDHIKPRRLFPHLALDLDNLQVLCHECNHGKGNWDQTDWRPEEVDQEVSQMLRDIAKFG